MNKRPLHDTESMLFAAGFIGIGVLALYLSRDMTALGSVFPRTISIAMIVFSIAYIVLRYLRPHPGVKVTSLGSVARRILLVLVMVSWALLLERIGFFVTSALAALLLLWVTNYDRWTSGRLFGYVISVLAVVGGLYAIFRFGLYVPLPTGILL